VVLLGVAGVGGGLGVGNALAEGAPPSSAYLAELTLRAETLGLAESPRWHALLHYRPGHFGRGVLSVASSADFFLSPEGRRDPHAELVATLAAFLGNDTVRGDEGKGRAAEHPQCAFPASRPGAPLSTPRA
jgi:hypothetical protein